MWKKLNWMVLWRLTRSSRTNTQKWCPFHYRGLECKVESQEIPGVTGTFGLGVQNEAGQRLTKFCRENTLVIANTFPNNPRDDSIHGHHQKVNSEIRLIILFVTEDREALYSQQKQDWELTLAQIISSLLQNSSFSWRKYGKLIGHSGVT